MPDPFSLKTSKTPLGRYDISIDDDMGIAFLIESIENEGRDSFWMPLQGVDGRHIGYIKFVATNLSPLLFQLDELRPANCPIQESPGDCKYFLNPQRKER